MVADSSGLAATGFEEPDRELEYDRTLEHAGLDIDLVGAASRAGSAEAVDDHL